jgi:hypothetical protein
VINKPAGIVVHPDESGHGTEPLFTPCFPRKNLSELVVNAPDHPSSDKERWLLLIAKTKFTRNFPSFPRP